MAIFYAPAELQLERIALSMLVGLCVYDLARLIYCATMNDDKFKPFND